MLTILISIKIYSKPNPEGRHFYNHTKRPFTCKKTYFNQMTEDCVEQDLQQSFDYLEACATNMIQ